MHLEPGKNVQESEETPAWKRGRNTPWRIRMNGTALRGVAAAAACAALLVWMMSRAGMYFDERYYGLQTMLCLAAACLLGAGMRRGTQEERRTEANRGAGRMKWLLTAACLLATALSALCVVGLAFSPVSVRGSLNEALRWSALAALIVLLRARPAGSRSLAGGIQLFAAAAVAVSAAAWFGWLRGTDYMLFTSDERLSASGMRLAGWLQYSNSLGAFMAALLVFQWKLLSAGNRMLRWSAALLAAPCFAVLVLTESRGSWAAAGAGLLLGLLLCPRNIRLRWLVSAAGTLGGGAALTGMAYRLGPAAWGMPSAEARLSETWAWAAAPAVLAVGALFLLQLVSRCRREEASDPISEPPAEKRSGSPIKAASSRGKRGWRSRLSTKPLLWRLLASGGFLLAAALLWLPLSPVHRAAASHETGASRLMYYVDALSIAAKAPFLGTGGDSWRSLYRSVQRVPYTGSEVHSGYIDQLVDHGAAGLLLMLLFAAVLLALAASGRKDGAAAPAVLLLHAAVDIDMSYGLFWMFLVFLAAGSVSMEAGGDGGEKVRRERHVSATPAKERGAPIVRRRKMPAIARRAALLLFACWLAAAAAASQPAAPRGCAKPPPARPAPRASRCCARRSRRTRHGPGSASTWRLSSRLAGGRRCWRTDCAMSRSPLRCSGSSAWLMPSSGMRRARKRGCARRCAWTSGTRPGRRPCRSCCSSWRGCSSGKERLRWPEARPGGRSGCMRTMQSLSGWRRSPGRRRIAAASA
ncbi:O-antigen ligase family protein [Paenibacillus sp. RUD330]|uniref:O-antigen ligase family protein n=1 Tax=Paenibacillus sp. RUD330 TaxID=2023772 RepID=UPI0013B49D7C|nr:O-antigen ligase family protein [Paenibacillus sp. RUD330]ASS66755.2 hypothetical protein CIC07_11725 [Paenibacillus sp. RUD330]